LDEPSIKLGFVLLLLQERTLRSNRGTLGALFGQQLGAQLPARAAMIVGELTA
jgi:hypothetical protein